MGDLVTILIQQGNIENRFQLIIAVIPDIGKRTAGLEKMVPLFPDPECVCLDAGNIFQVFDGEGIHAIKLIIL